MRIFKNKVFQSWAQEQRLEDPSLIKAIEELKQGLYEANLGGNIYKKRVALGSQGKRGGARTIIALKMYGKAFFIYGFAKNKRANITHREEEALKALAKVYFNYSEAEIELAIKKGEFFEVR
jgi:hypothetical protein